jgi:hypothetical protein
MRAWNMLSRHRVTAPEFIIGLPILRRMKRYVRDKKNNRAPSSAEWQTIEEAL